MNAKRIFLLTWLVLISLTSAAQKAEPVKSLVESGRDSAWYATQVRAWAREVAHSPKNEGAWQNYFDAARYLCMYRDDYSPLDELLQRMKRRIPGTFTYHYCRYRSRMSLVEAAGDMEKAIELGADRVDAYDAFIGYLWGSGQFSRMYDFGRRYFESGRFSPGLLQYSYNQLQGMPEGALFIGNGDSELIPKIVLQGGKNVHRDKVIVVLSYLNQHAYVDALCRQLGIEPPTVPERPADWEATADSVVQYLIDHSGRPVYFAPTIGERRLQRFSRHLYSEGLALRYSKQPYDNLAVMKRNVEQRYLLDYLHMSFVPQEKWAADTRL